MQVQVSSVGERNEELSYIKTSSITSDVGKIKLVMGSEELYNPFGEKQMTVIFLGGE